MTRGYVKVWRRIKESPWYKKPNISHLAQHLIREANHNPQRLFVNNEIIELNRGQIITGRKELSRETGLTEQEIRTAINSLIKCDFLTSKSTNKFTIITICNYDIYNHDATSNQPTDQPASNQQLTTNKNVKNKRRKEIKNIVFDSSVFDPVLIKEFTEYRKAKKAPLTQKSLDSILKTCVECHGKGFFESPNAAVVEIMSRGWQSIKIEWVEKNKNTGGANGTGRKNSAGGSGFAEARKSGKTEWLS